MSDERSYPPITYCPTCSNVISLNAVSCPKCGERYGPPFDDNVSFFEQFRRDPEYFKSTLGPQHYLLAISIVLSLEFPSTNIISSTLLF